VASENDNNNIFIAIGQGISIWALMEGNLVHVFAKLMRSSAEKSGLVLYSIMNFNIWLTIITDLFASDPIFKELKDRWNQIFERLRVLNNTRIRLAHHTALLGPRALIPGRLDTRPKSLSYKPLTEKEIGNFTDSLVEITNEISNLSCQMFQLLSSVDKCG
jgi:hypothetical protein